jgi:ABC-type branched-subunit amino acid transport system substrate-binding protein
MRNGIVRTRGRAARIVLAALACSVVALSAAAAAGARGTAGSINEAVIAPLSGPAANLGKFITFSCDAAAADIDKAGGILGNKLNCSPVDDTGDPADAVPAVTRALATGHIAMGSGLETNTAAVTIPLLNNAKIPFFTSNGLPAFDKTKDAYFWRIIPSDQQDGAAFAVWASKKHFRSAAVIIQTGEGNEDAQPGILHALHKLHVKVAISLDIPGDAASYASVVSKVMKTHPAVIIGAADPQTSATFFSQYKQLNNGNVPPLITPTDSLTPDYFHAIQKVMGTAWVTHHVYLVGYHVDPKSGAYKAYVGSLKAASQIPKSDVPILAGIGPVASLFDGDVVMALAMTAANSTDGSVWNGKVASIVAPGKGKTVVHTYAQGVAALKAHKQIDYVGTGGQIYLDRFHNSPGNFSATSFKADGSPNLLGVFAGALVASALK